jgi:phage terminase large subunit-like protein
MSMQEIDAPMDPIDALRLLVADETRAAEALGAVISIGQGAARAYRRTLLRLQRGERIKRTELAAALVDVDQRLAALAQATNGARTLTAALGNLSRKSEPST